MDRKQMHRWVDLSEIQIPPVERPGFDADVLEREIWTAAESGEQNAKDAQPQSEEHPKRQITLTRINSPDQEVIHVQGDTFIIGKSRNADYTVAGNPAISRMHLMIYRVGDDYYAEDQGSLNHTYIDEEMLTGPYRLRNGLVIRIANEDFILRMD